ncbi:secreted frizzled-related protein 5 [Dermochelys coriacea]|uniref:secreted frizzled-related protein 5 n=1 Tax=Dermochelys coriacea TaxID=27794 RepID=UPI0018E8E6FD|nr:secreted frizzled-related protein 5 [Dermochelys coriacea]
MPRQGGTRGPLGIVLLALALRALPAVGQDDDYSSWQPEQLPSGLGYGKRPQCVDIPADLQLCHEVGYKRMWLPNLLEHDSLAEVKQQASAWLPLLAKRCHSDTQLFLCSLFAPVCLDRPIYPCRSLCQVVRASCAPLMEAFGFPWPDMLHCARFPPDHHLCIAVQFGSSQVTPPPASRVCPQCEMEHKAEGMMEQMCASDFVLKTRLRELRAEGGERRLAAARKKKLLKRGPLQRPDARRLVLHMRNAAACPCPQLADLRRPFLLLGALYRWERSNREMRFALKFMFSYPCPPRYAPLPGAEQR